MVFPLVPVTPASSSASPGRPWRLAAAMAMARRADGASRSSAGAQSTLRSATTATAPRLAASAAKSWPSAFTPGRAKKTVPGPTSRESPVTRRTIGSDPRAPIAPVPSITLESVIPIVASRP